MKKNKTTKTRENFKKIWDSKIAVLINATFEKFEAELNEHGKLMKWVAKHILIPLAIIYLILGFIIQKRVVDSLFLGFLIFIYSGFVPDLDSLLIVAKNKLEKPDVIEKLALLLLGPVFVYYAISGEAKPIHAKKKKEFHSVEYLAIYCLFLLIIGMVFYGNLLEIISLPIFGGLGYATHLTLDGYIKT
jgi:hypothetical protein